MSTEIYANGRTYEEHSAWLNSLDGDEKRIVHTPPGVLMNLAYIAWFKYFLLNVPMRAGDRMDVFDCISGCITGMVTVEAVEAIEPAGAPERAIFHELRSLPKEKVSQAFFDGDCFRTMARCNASLLRALELCR